MEAFYQSVLKTQQKLTIRMREYCLDYADFILSSDSTFDDKYDEFDEMFDVIYEDAGDEIFDEIYEGLFADIYDDFYDGILSDAYDTVPYKEWSDTHSDEYDLWSDTHSDLYDDWSDFHSDVYDFWSDMKGEMWDDDLEKAREKMDDFREDSTMMTKLADMDEKFKAWEEKDLNTKEQKYYLEVNNRILQKLVEVEE